MTMCTIAIGCQRMTTLVNISGLSGYRSLVEALGGDPQQLMQKLGLAPGLFELEEHYIPLTTVSALLEETALALRQPGFGLILSRKQGTHILGGLGLLIESASDLQSALDYLRQFFALHIEGAAIELVNGVHDTAIRYTLPAPVSGKRQVTELGLGVIAGCLRTLLGASWSPANVCFMHDAGAHPDLYRTIFRAPVTFGQISNALTISAELLARPIDRHTSGLESYLQRHVETALRARGADFCTQVRHLITRKLPSGSASLEQVAAALGIRPRTLQHRLTQKKTTFFILTEEVRAGLARKYLAESDLALSQLAARLGYADQAVFSRAFRRWHGVAPSLWRRQKRRRGIHSRMIDYS